MTPPLPPGVDGEAVDPHIHTAVPDDRDSADLLSEVERLTDINGKLALTIKACPEGHHDANLAHARAERDQLRAEVERLKADRRALDIAVTGLRRLQDKWAAAGYECPAIADVGWLLDKIGRAR